MITAEQGDRLPHPDPDSLASSPIRVTEPGPSNRPEGGPSYVCPYEGCSKGYTKPSKLAQHIRSHTGERPFVCDHPGCGASYMRNEHLKAHQRRHRDASEKPFACQYEGCTLKFWTSSQLKNHVRACHDDHFSDAIESCAHDYVCTEDGCEMSFHKRKHLRQHIREHHSGPSAPICQGVDVSIEQGQEKMQISDTQALPFACHFPGCNKRFAANSKRKTHSRTHEDGRYTCSMDHSQPQQGDSQGSGPFIYTFPTWSALQAHMKQAHPPICPWPECGKQFQRQDNLRAHYRRHEERKLRLEMEAKLLEGSHESERNRLRAEMSDDSYASMSEQEEEHHAQPHVSGQHMGSSPQIGCPSHHETDGQTLPQQGKRLLTWDESLSSTLVQSAPLTEEELVRKAAQLHSSRPRRGGVFRDLSSPALSVVSSSSGKTGSARLRSIATSITSVRALPSAFACTWNGCSKVYTRKSTLSIHIRSAHLGERPFECSNCGRRFAHKHLASRHRRVCTGLHLSPEEGANSGSRLRFSLSEQPEQMEGKDSDEAEDDSHQDSGSETSSTTTTSEDDQGIYKEAVSVHGTNSTSSAIKPRLLDLLTGRGYSASHNGPHEAASPQRLSVDASEPAPKKRRTTRNRIFGCPWSKICSALDKQMIDPELFMTDAVDTAPATSDTQLLGTSSVTATCEHRFKRIYDLRRHLRAQHGLDLTTEELSAITHQTAWTHVH